MSTRVSKAFKGRLFRFIYIYIYMDIYIYIDRCVCMISIYDICIYFPRALVERVTMQLGYLTTWRPPRPGDRGFKRNGPSSQGFREFQSGTKCLPYIVKSWIILW